MKPISSRRSRTGAADLPPRGKRPPSWRSPAVGSKRFFNSERLRWSCCPTTFIASGACRAGDADFPSRWKRIGGDFTVRFLGERQRGKRQPRFPHASRGANAACGSAVSGSTSSETRSYLELLRLHPLRSAEAWLCHKPRRLAMVHLRGLSHRVIIRQIGEGVCPRPLTGSVRSSASSEYSGCNLTVSARWIGGFHPRYFSCW